MRITIHSDPLGLRPRVPTIGNNGGQIKKIETGQMMSYLFSVEDDLQTCVEQLVEFGLQSNKFQVIFGKRHNQGESLDFTIRQNAPTIRAAHPFFRGTLLSSAGTTQVSGQIRKNRLGARFIKLWCYLASVLGALSLALLSVSTVQIRLGGYAQEPSNQAIFPLAFVFAAIFIASFVEKMKPLEPSEPLEWLYSCFDKKQNEKLIEAAKAIKKEVSFKGLTRRVLICSAAGLIAGTLLGISSDVEETLDPLRITVTDVHTCAQSDDGSSFVRKETFEPTEEIYGCGHLDIEIIDHRQIKIPIWLRRDYQNSNEGPAGHIAHEVNAEGNFALQLREPKDGRYQIGQYTMEIGRSKNRYGKITFDVVE